MAEKQLVAPYSDEQLPRIEPANYHTGWVLGGSLLVGAVLIGAGASHSLPLDHQGHRLQVQATKETNVYQAATDHHRGEVMLGQASDWKIATTAGIGIGIVGLGSFFYLAAAETKRREEQQQEYASEIVRLREDGVIPLGHPFEPKN